MKPVAKVGIVFAGYIIAVAVAMLVLRVYVAATSSADRQTYGAMFAFGDDLLFLAVLGIAAIPATGAALYFLRSRRAFWVGLSVTALAVACTAVMAVVLFLGSRSGGGWAAIAPLRILVAPLFALFFLLAAAFAPMRSVRLRLLGASAIEMVAFVCVAFMWWHSRR